MNRVFVVAADVDDLAAARERYERRVVDITISGLAGVDEIDDGDQLVITDAARQARGVLVTFVLERWQRLASSRDIRRA